MTSLRLAATVLCLGCVQPNPYGERAARSGAGDAAAGGGAMDAARPTPAPSQPPPAADAGPPPVEEPCEPGARGCSAMRDATRLCTDARRWTFEATCQDGKVCSAGRCLCPGPLCDDGVLVRTSGEVYQIAAGGEFLHFQRYVPDLDLTGIHRVELSTHEVSAVLPDGPGQSVGALATDAAGTPYWCRVDRAGRPDPGLMRGSQRLETVSCFDLVASGGALYFQTSNRPGLHRRALDAPGVRTLWGREPQGYALDGGHLYVSALDEDLTSDRMIVRRIRLDDPGQVQIVATQPQPRDRSFDAMVVDGRHLYADDGERIVRAPIGGGAMETFWQGNGSAVMALALGDDHLYWSTAIPAAVGCLETAVWRQPRGRGEPPTMLASFPGVCPTTDLPLVGEHLYLALFSVQTASQIVRLRR